VKAIRGFLLHAISPRHFRTIATSDITPTVRPTQSDDTRRCPPLRPFDIHTMEPIESLWQAIKEWIPDDEPDLDWFNRPRDPSNPDPDGIDQSQTWQAPEIHLEDGRILVLEYS